MWRFWRPAQKQINLSDALNSPMQLTYKRCVLQMPSFSLWLVLCLSALSFVPTSAQYACNCAFSGYGVFYKGSFAVSSCSLCNVVPNDCGGYFPEYRTSVATCTSWPTTDVCTFEQYRIDAGCSLSNQVGSIPLKATNTCVAIDEGTNTCTTHRNWSVVSADSEDD